MAPVKKTRRQSKLPAKLDEFALEDVKEKEPRRSRRTPKLSEKLKNYMDEKSGSIKKEKSDEPVAEQIKRICRATPSSEQQLLGARMEPKVVLKALPSSLLQSTTTKKHITGKKEARVSLKRLSNLSLGSKKGSSARIPRLQNQKQKRTSAPSSSPSPAAPTKKPVKRKLECTPTSQDSTTTKSQAKRKRTSARTSESKAKDCDIIGRNIKNVSQFDPDIMKKLLSFGAKVADVIAVNNEAIRKLTKEDTERAHSLGDSIADRFEDIDDKQISKIVTWLEEEENQRSEYKKRVLESLRASHETNMVLYSHMLSVLESVTAGV